MNDIERRPNRLPWPPMLYVSAIALAVLANLAYTLPWFTPPLSEILFAVGWLLVAAVVAIDVSAMRTLMRARTTILPHRGADHLVTGGPFSFSRNPIYLANTLLMIGVGLISGIAWFILFAVAAAFVTQKLAIEREERHLEQRFGKRYRDYRKKVRRWI